MGLTAPGVCAGLLTTVCLFAGQGAARQLVSDWGRGAYPDAGAPDAVGAAGARDPVE